MKQRIKLEEEPKQMKLKFKVKKSKIGFAIPSYNRLIYLYETLKNIKKHCKSLDYHVYVIEDCSTKKEAVGQLIDEIKIMLKYNRLTLQQNPRNRGLGYGWHTGGRLAYENKCKYTIYMDDDVLINNTDLIIEMQSILENNPHIGYVAPNGSLLRKYSANLRKQGVTLQYQSSCGGGFAMVRTADAKYINFHDRDCRRAVDVEFCFRMWLSGKACAVALNGQIDHTVYKYGGLQYPKDRMDPGNDEWQLYLINKFQPIMRRNKKHHMTFWRRFKNMSPDDLISMRMRFLQKDDMSYAEAEKWLQEVNELA